MRYTARVFLLILTAVASLSCGKGDNPPEPFKPENEDVAVTKILPSDEKITLSVGAEHAIDYTVLPANATDKEILITSDHPSIVSVSGKVVKALSVGTATVVLENKTSQVTATIKISVASVTAKQIALDKEELKLYVDQTEKITAQILPENATDKTIVWTSTNPGIAKVNEDGEIQALKIGTTEIVASNSDGSVKSKAKVSVLEDIAFITGRLKFAETSRDGKRHITMETQIDNKLNTDITVLAVEGYFDGNFGAVDLNSFTKIIVAEKESQIVNQFSGTTTLTNTDYQQNWFTKVFFTLKGLSYCLTTKTNGSTIVKVQNSTIGLNPNWNGESTTEF